MRPKTSKRLVRVLLSCAWAAVLVAAVGIALAKREEYGPWVYLVPVMAAAMLAIFLAALPRVRAKRERLTSAIGQIATGALILCAIGVLAYALVAGGIGPVRTLVLGLFLVIFSGIFRDYVRHLRDAGRKEDRRRAPRQADDQQPPPDDSE
jgi:hypothetical protein